MLLFNPKIIGARLGGVNVPLSTVYPTGIPLTVAGKKFNEIFATGWPKDLVTGGLTSATLSWEFDIVTDDNSGAVDPHNFTLTCELFTSFDGVTNCIYEPTGHDAVDCTSQTRRLRWTLRPFTGA